MKLHYSQTTFQTFYACLSFSTLWNYTTLKQMTCSFHQHTGFSTLWNYTTLKQALLSASIVIVSVPYEITLLSNCYLRDFKTLIVSVPYEITLLSNRVSSIWGGVVVSVPYEITLLSNRLWLLLQMRHVSVPYEITLLSNTQSWKKRTYRFQYLMKLHYSQTMLGLSLVSMSFSTLWNYTTLKQSPWARKAQRVSVPYEITLLSNKVFSEGASEQVSVPYEITLLSNT